MAANFITIDEICSENTTLKNTIIGLEEKIISLEKQLISSKEKNNEF